MKIYGPERAFRGVHLEVVDGHNMGEEMFLGAHCQRMSIEEAWTMDWDRTLQGERSRMCADGRRVQVQVGCRQVAVPAWAAFGAAAGPQPGSLYDVAPRCVFRATGRAPPPNRDARGMSRNRLPGRCKVSRQDFLLDGAGQEAMRDVE